MHAASEGDSLAVFDGRLFSNPVSTLGITEWDWMLANLPACCRALAAACTYPLRSAAAGLAARCARAFTNRDGRGLRGPCTVTTSCWHEERRRRGSCRERKLPAAERKLPIAAHQAPPHHPSMLSNQFVHSIHRPSGLGGAGLAQVPILPGGPRQHSMLCLAGRGAPAGARPSQQTILCSAAAGAVPIQKTMLWSAGQSDAMPIIIIT